MWQSTLWIASLNPGEGGNNMATRKASGKTALLIYCTFEEAEQIKLAAKRERRTISGFVMNAVMARFAVEGRLRE
jgi:hypothetical protein